MTTKLTDNEFALITRHAAPMTVSGWARERLLGAVQFGEVDLLHVALLAEVAALRTITINMMFQAVPVGSLNAEVITNTIALADREKFDLARQRLTSPRNTTAGEIGGS